MDFNETLFQNFKPLIFCVVLNATSHTMIAELLKPKFGRHLDLYVWDSSGAYYYLQA